MSDQDLHSEYADLISRYLSGNASDAEVQQLEDWVMAAAENKRQFKAFKKAWMLSGVQQQGLEVDVDGNWQMVQGVLFGDTPVISIRRKSRRRRWMALAAAVALIAAFSIWLLQDGRSVEPVVVEATDQLKRFELPDGSQIALNQASKLQYSEENGQGNRKAVLTGDAFFDVARDATRPFIIDASGLRIEVKGTSFYVDARSNQSTVEVTVASGLVAVRYGSVELEIGAGDKAVFSKKSETLTTQANDDPNFASLKTNVLEFKGTSLEEVVATLNRHFRANIVLDVEDTANCAVEQTIPLKDLSLSTIIKLLTGSLEGIKANETETSIVLSGVGCK